MKNRFHAFSVLCVETRLLDAPGFAVHDPVKGSVLDALCSLERTVGVLIFPVCSVRIFFTSQPTSTNPGKARQSHLVRLFPSECFLHGLLSNSRSSSDPLDIASTSSTKRPKIDMETPHAHPVAMPGCVLGTSSFPLGINVEIDLKIAL